MVSFFNLGWHSSISEICCQDGLEAGWQEAFDPPRTFPTWNVCLNLYFLTFTHFALCYLWFCWTTTLASLGWSPLATLGRSCLEQSLINKKLTILQCYFPMKDQRVTKSMHLKHMISVEIAWIPCVIVVFLECCWLGRGRGSWSWFWYNLGFWSWFSSDHGFWSWFRCYFFFPLDLNPKNISELQKRDIERKDEVGANLYSNEFDSSTRWNIPQWFRAVQQLLLCVLIRSFGDVVEAVDDHNLQNSFFDCKEGVFHPKSSVKACLRRKHLKKGKCYGNFQIHIDQFL